MKKHSTGRAMAQNKEDNIAGNRENVKQTEMTQKERMIRQHM